MAIAEAETRTAAAVEIVVPVLDEAHVLRASIERLHAYLTASFPFGFEVTIADNGSSDGTWEIATQLAEELPGVRAVHVDQRGRGRALHQTWLQSDAAVLAYMDVDLSTDLAALLPLVAPLVSGHSDLAIGTRLSRGARVVRGPKRELVSRSYNTLLRWVLRVRAERLGLRIHEVPVDWTDDPDSRVDIVATAVGDLRGVARLVLVRQVLRFATIGAASTLAYLLLYSGLRSVLGAQAANAIALLLTAIANTAANR